MRSQKYTIDEILDVKFKKKAFGGVSLESVDEFLNGVIDDYEYFINKISELKKSNEDLRNENFKIKMNVLKQATNTLDLTKEAELGAASELVEVSRVEPTVEAPVTQEPQVIAEPVIETPAVEPTPVVEAPVVESAPVAQEAVAQETPSEEVKSQEEILSELERLKEEMSKLQNK